MRRLARPFAILPLLAVCMAAPASATETESVRTFSARFVVNGPTSADAAGTGTVEEGKAWAFGSWDGRTGEFADSQGYGLVMTPILDGEVMNLEVRGALNDAYGTPVDGARPIMRSRFRANVSLQRSVEGWTYEQAGLPGGRTMRVTFEQK